MRNTIHFLVHGWLLFGEILGIHMPPVGTAELYVIGHAPNFMLVTALL